MSPNFQLYEFACKDRSDEVLVDDNLVELLQQASNDLQRKITIISGYRTESYNASPGVKGAKNSYHVRGQAADIQVEGLTPWQVALYFEHYGNKKARAIGMYDSWVHVDTRTTALYKYRKLKGKMGHFNSTNNVETRTDTFGTKEQAIKPKGGVKVEVIPAEIVMLVDRLIEVIEIKDRKGLEQNYADLKINKPKFYNSMVGMAKKLMAAKVKRTDESLTLIERVLANIEVSDSETAKNAINDQYNRPCWHVIDKLLKKNNCC